MAIETNNQLSLHQARQSQLENSSNYIEKFLASVDVRSDYGYVCCPTCGRDAGEPLFIKRQGRYSYCPSCDHIYLANPLNADKLFDFYAGYPTSSLEWHQNESEFYCRIYLRGLSMLQAQCACQRLLDIGCSSGLFLSMAAKLKINSFGIEPNKKEAEFARQNGINILGSSLADLSPSDFFDCITLWDVLEHIPEPVAYLQALHGHLNTKGCIFVQIPTSDSLAARVMRGSCNMFDGIEHLTLFSAHSLTLAFEAAGYELASLNTVISESHALANFLSYQIDPYLSQPERQFTAAFLDPEAIESCGLGYKIQAVYRRCQ